MRAALDRTLARAGLAATVALEAGDPLVVADLAARGLGLAVLPAGLVAFAPTPSTRSPSAAPTPGAPSRSSGVPTAPPSPAGRAFVTHARATLQPT